MLLLEHGSVWSWNLDAPCNRSETPAKFWNVVMEKISWTDHVRNEVLLRVNEQRNILYQIRKRMANWIGHILRRNYLLQQVIEGNTKGQIEVTRRRGRRRKKLLDDLKDRRGYCQLKEEALDRTMWRNRFGRGFGPVVWQITNDDGCVCCMWVNTVIPHGTNNIKFNCYYSRTPLIRTLVIRNANNPDRFRPFGKYFRTLTALYLFYDFNFTPICQIHIRNFVLMFHLYVHKCCLKQLFVIIFCPSLKLLM